MHERSYHIEQEFTAACHLLDVDPQRILMRMGFPTTDTQAREGLHVSAWQVAKIFEHLAQEYGKDDIHLRLADGFAKGAFGHAFLALQCSETLREGIHRLARFKPLIEPVNWVITESGTALTIELHDLSADFPLVGIGQIMSFLWLVKSSRNLTGKELVPIRVIITDAVPHQAEIEQELGCPIEIGSSACLVLPQSAMDALVLSANPAVVRGLDAGLSHVSAPAAEDNNLVAAIYSMVLELLPSGVVTLERVARRLALSKRTLERRLAERGVRFNEIVRDCRRDMARHYLTQTPLAIAEISFLLGYREINSFYRAFREWFGVSPQEYKNKPSP